MLRVYRTVTLLSVGLLSFGSAFAQNSFIVEMLFTTAEVTQSELAVAGGIPGTVGNDKQIFGHADAYASLDTNNTAFQSTTGINAVRTGGVFFNLKAANQIVASTDFQVTGRVVGPDLSRGSDLFLDYLVFPGVVGLDTFAAPNSEARIFFSVKPPLTSHLPETSGQVKLSTGTAFGIPTATIDPIFISAGVQTVGQDFEGFPMRALETQPFMSTAFLGSYHVLDVLTFRYVMSASISVPGTEKAALARVGDPFSLRADTAGEIAKFFPEGTLPFRVRVEPALAVPEADMWLMMLAGLGLVGFAVSRRKRT